MNRFRVATGYVSLAFSLALPSPLFAGGTVTHLSGTVSILKVSGTTENAKNGSKVDNGDTLITGPDGFVRMEMTDGGEMILRPYSELKIDRYVFNKDQPKDDSFVFNMVKGGMRTISGLIGKRGELAAYQGRTATATIGIRGTQYDLKVCAGDCGALANGTYLAVKFGAVAVENPQGSLNVAAGQVGYVAANLPPVTLPRDPGIGFTPPANIPKLDEKKKLEKKAAEDKAAAEAEAKKKTETEEKKKSESEDKKKSDDKKSDDKKDDKKSDSKSEGKSETKADTKSDAKSDSKSDDKAASGTGTSNNAPATQGGSSSASGGGAECSVE